MERKIMVEVTEEELKELNKEKTLDDYVNELLKYLDKTTPDRTSCNIDRFTGLGVAQRLYETQKYRVYMTAEVCGETTINIEKKGKIENGS